MEPAFDGLGPLRLDPVLEVPRLIPPAPVPALALGDKARLIKGRRLAGDGEREEEDWRANDGTAERRVPLTVKDEEGNRGESSSVVISSS